VGRYNYPQALGTRPVVLDPLPATERFYKFPEKLGWDTRTLKQELTST